MPTARLVKLEEVMSSILVIEDEPNIRRFVATNLTARGFQVEEAENAEAGLELLERDNIPVVIILDIRLPGMSGLDMLQILLSNTTFASIPVIVMTASGLGGQFDVWQFDNVVQWLVKPISVQELLIAVRNVLDD